MIPEAKANGAVFVNADHCNPVFRFKNAASKSLEQTPNSLKLNTKPPSFNMNIMHI